VIAPVYGLIAWRREQYRHLLWLPYAGQLAIILPTFYDLVISHDGRFEDSALILIVSLIFFALMVYLWWSSHPLEHFAVFGDEEEDEDEEGWDEEEDEGDEEEPDPGATPPRGAARPGDTGGRTMRPPPV